MGLAIILFAGAVVILLWLFLWSLQRQRLGQTPELEAALGDLPLLSSSDAVIVASEHGQILHANETIRRWLDMRKSRSGSDRPSASSLSIPSWNCSRARRKPRSN